MDLVQIKDRLINFKKNDTRFGPALEEGELLETYVKAVIGKNWSDKLPITHPSGYDFFYDSDDPFKPSYYIDIKASKHSMYGGNCFIEYIQNWSNDKNKKANHYSGRLEDGINYMLLYVDTTKSGFGNSVLFDVRKLRQHFADESCLVKGGWDARGFLVNASNKTVARSIMLPEVC